MASVQGKVRTLYFPNLSLNLQRTNYRANHLIDFRLPGKTMDSFSLDLSIFRWKEKIDHIDEGEEIGIVVINGSCQGQRLRVDTIASSP